MNHICTWFCADKEGEESIFPQTGQKSSSQSHQDIYWRCIIVFYVTSTRFNSNVKHILFTNVSTLPIVDGRDINVLLKDLGVSLIFTDFKYKTPKGYFGTFQNQFYEFSILEHIANFNKNLEDHYLILDSDCVFLKSADDLFKAAKPFGFISFEDDVKPDFKINGLSRNDLKSIYEVLLKKEIDEIPTYHLGEFLLSNVANIIRIFEEFKIIWPKLISLHNNGQPKFNEEAHTLSYLYFKNGLKASKDKTFMKRIWTNPLFYRNVENSDTALAIWHLPSEKTFGIKRLYDFLVNKVSNYGFLLTDDKYIEHLQRIMNIPYLPPKMRFEYYFKSYYRAARKRLKNVTAI